MYKHIQAAVHTCVVCKNVEAPPLVTGHQRTREYDGPFRYLVIDYVGPMMPESKRGRKYMFTVLARGVDGIGLSLLQTTVQRLRQVPVLQRHV